MEFAFDQAERSLQAQELVDGEITAVIGGLFSLLNGHSIAELSCIGEGEVNRMAARRTNEDGQEPVAAEKCGLRYEA